MSDLQNAQSDRRVLTVAEFVRGYGVSTSSFYRMRAAGLIPTRKVGARTVILRDDAEAWFASLPATRSEVA